MTDLSHGQRRRLASELLAPTRQLAEFEASFEKEIDAPQKGFIEAQSAIKIARLSAIEAIFSAHTLNRIQKISEGKSTQGKFTSAAQGSMRSALLFAGAGLDRALKQLVTDALPALVEFEEGTLERLHKFAESHLSAKDAPGIDPKSLVRILLSKGQTPKSLSHVVSFRSFFQQVTAAAS